MKACIFGVGAMGLPAAWAMQQLGFDLQLVEEEEDRYDHIESLLGVRPQCPTYVNSIGECIDEDCDVVISCVPYVLTEHVAEDCGKKKIPYCDLGGNPEVSERIHDLGDLIPVFTDLGLAPGFLNIIAEHACHVSPNTEKVLIRCGGLPANEMDNRLQYARVFHVGGLMNEYSGMCDVIEDGVIKRVPALSGIEETTTWGEDKVHWEMFHTKGGSNGSLQSMLDRGVQEFNYKTIRFKGHVDYIKFLMEDCKITGREFCQAITNACPRTKEDIVIMTIEADNYYKFIEIEYDENWTAMQKGTAFPTAAVAAILAEHKGQPKLWTYVDVPIDQFRKNLKSICGEELLF